MISFRNEHGATLLVSLVILLILLLSGLSLTNMTLMSAKATANAHSREMALHAAEYALADAEADIENSRTTNSRSEIFSPLSNQGFLEGCGRGNSNLNQGLCFPSEPPGKPIWLTENIADPGANSPSVALGRFTGRSMPVGKGSLSSRLPRYIIELIKDTTVEQSAQPRYMYRITAIGFGTSDAAEAVVQSYYRKTSY